MVFNPVQHSLDFERPLRKRSFENILEKGEGENAGNHYFLLFIKCFLTFLKQNSNFELQLICLHGIELTLF